MGASTDLTVTPRPIYHADGRKSPDCYTYPAAAARQPHRPARRLPALPVLGPDGEHQVHQVDRRRGARSCSTTSRSTCCSSTCRTSTTTTSASAPKARRPSRPRSELDEVAGDLIDHARGRGDQVVVLSEYGITAGQAPGRDQPRAAPRRAAERLHAGGHGVPGPVDLTRVRGRRPPDRPRLRRRTRPTCPPRARRSPRSTAWGRSSRASRWPPPAWPTSAPASWSSSPSATPGSPTTTGSTTPTPRTSAARSRSTASRATTPPSCSWTRTTRRAPSCAPASRSRAR